MLLVSVLSGSVNGGTIARHLDGGSWKDDVFTAAEKNNITYCVALDFGMDHARVVDAADKAALRWESVADVDFIYVPSKDPVCHDEVAADVTFSIRSLTEVMNSDPNWDGGTSFTAVAAYPSQLRLDPAIYPDQNNSLILNYGDHSGRDDHPSNAVHRIDLADEPRRGTVGIMTHEFGHILGLYHEAGHTQFDEALYPCFINDYWDPNTKRDVGAFDPYSVMNFVEGDCEAIGSYNEVSAGDAATVSLFYGPSGITSGCEQDPVKYPGRFSPDNDGDQVCDTVDVCWGHDDNLDADSDGIPDGCDVFEPITLSAVDDGGSSVTTYGDFANVTWEKHEGTLAPNQPIYLDAIELAADEELQVYLENVTELPLSPWPRLAVSTQWGQRPESGNLLTYYFTLGDHKRSVEIHGDAVPAGVENKIYIKVEAVNPTGPASTFWLSVRKTNPDGGSLPGEAQQLTVTRGAPGELILQWSGDCGGASTFGIYRGDLVAGYDSINPEPGQCDVAGTSATVADGTDLAEFFLVVPNLNGEEGSFGAATAGPRYPALSPCYPQNVIDSCAP